MRGGGGAMLGTGVGNERISCLIKLKLFGGEGGSSRLWGNGLPPL